MIKVYCYDRCTTCKKALKYLDDLNISYEKIDIKSNHPSEEELRSLKEKSGYELRKFFNTSGLLYKELGLAKKMNELSDDEKYKLLSSDGMLVKRPLLISDDVILLGFKEEEYKKLKK
ncbi:MAG: arsenate reductase family protein [Gammaproteobacteria bacterium]|nr:arsenate reductase family protein [Gammaproteobacteria bacterium]